MGNPFDRRAAIYDESRWQLDVARILVNGLTESQVDHWLDICCGTGNVARAVAESGGLPGHVVCVDSSGPMLDRLRHSDLPLNLDVREHDAVDLRNVGLMDVVTCSLGLHYIDHKALGKSLPSVCHEGTQLAFSVPVAGTSFTARVFADVMTSHLGADPLKPPGAAYGANWLSNWMQGIPCVVEGSLSRPLAMGHVSGATSWVIVSQMNEDALRNLPEGELAEIACDFMERIDSGADGVREPSIEVAFAWGRMVDRSLK